MTAADIHRDNAYRYSDSFAVVCRETQQCVGTEHNKEEAEALAKWLRHNRGGGAYDVEHNGPDLVRAAQAARPDMEPFRHPAREEAFEEMGLWQKPRRRRSRSR